MSNIVLKNSEKSTKHYLLIFGNNNILKDTLLIPNNEVYSLNVKFKNNKNGISLGFFDKNTSYFKINKHFELDKNLKLKLLPINTQIVDCPLPVEFLSEENVGIENLYKYGTQKEIRRNNTVDSDQDKLSQWRGEYVAKFEIAKIDDDFQIVFNVKISNNDSILVVEQIDDEKNEIQHLYIDVYRFNF